MQDIFIGRQPIFDRDLRVYAYELLFRNSDTNAAGFTDGDQATSRVISNSFIEIGLDKIVGRHRAFLNLTRGFLINDWPLPFPKDKVVLEILEDIEPDEEVIRAVGSLRAQGFSLALDDFIYHASLKPLIEHAEIIKIDIKPLSEQALIEHVRELRNYPVRLLAEKIETQDEFRFCRELGFEYFQGYFLSRPKVISAREIPPNGLATVQLLGRLQDPQASAEELERLISQDVGLSYKLLRYINSAFFSLPKAVESIRQAVVYLGNRAIKTWATLLVFSGIEDKPHELMTTAMLRAKMCELLAEASGEARSDAFFTVGLFSALEPLLEAPLPKVLDSLPLSDEIRNALLAFEGPYGEALRCTLAYETAEWERVHFNDLSGSQITEIYMQAAQWADEATQMLAN
ncbi:HDOD domain-containing protein [Thiohalobacter sp. IOR34]|uniref:EAL and HDOD domain-containing protein n=1 Tax=Thiohalobacter sp. IOR34 TaxID=3057176 RepID=UPI0025B0DE53|nr:HDOD domain-containing protein [Thiohalobacter sp. IOR34]WJW75761.1 HDOD domain-containing protein [Thiohalobacter sp. IOR34]